MCQTTNKLISDYLYIWNGANMSYIVGVVRLIHWWKTRSTRRKLPTCRKLKSSLNNQMVHNNKTLLGKCFKYMCT
jgi:hypothetical protein